MSTYKIIEGLPKDVEIDTVNHISQGWRRNGELFHRQVDGNNIAVQGMVRDEEEAVPNVYVYRLFCKMPVDFNGLINSVYHRVEHPQKTGWFNYLVKIRAYSKEDAEKALLDEVLIQHAGQLHSATPMYLNVEYYV